MRRVLRAVYALIGCAGAVTMWACGSSTPTEPPRIVYLLSIDGAVGARYSVNRDTLVAGVVLTKHAATGDTTAHPVPGATLVADSTVAASSLFADSAGRATVRWLVPHFPACSPGAVCPVGHVTISYHGLDAVGVTSITLQGGKYGG